MFDPNIPAPNTRLRSAEMRGQFTALKALIDAIPAGTPGPQGPAGPTGPAGAVGAPGPSIGAVPVGSLSMWLQDYPGTPALPAEFAICDGHLLNDSASPYDGMALPDLRGLFLRGAASSGGTGGSDSHTHDVELTGISAGDPGASGGSPVPWGNYPTTAASSLPPYYEVVYVMRVR